MNFVTFAIKPFLLRWGAILLLALAIWTHGWLKGASHEERKAQALLLKQETDAIEHVQKLAKKGHELTVVWIRGQRELEEKIREVEVTKYVTKESDKCPVPVGLVRLWDDSADVQARIYQPSSGVDDPAIGVALSDIGRGILEARRRFEVNKLQCEALQEWARSLQ